MASEEFTQLCKDLEHFETPQWAAREILKHEILTNIVIDPCVGVGILANEARAASYIVKAFDIHDWGFRDTHFEVCDFLSILALDFPPQAFSIFMNPPFSLAEKFVEKSFELGARKIVCFQRFAWWESRGRRTFWDKYPPNRIYICGDRADCWRHDIAQDQRGSSSPTAHAWFVWEPAHPSGTLLSHIYKDKKK